MSALADIKAMKSKLAAGRKPAERTKAAATVGRLAAEARRPADPELDRTHGFKSPREFILKVLSAGKGQEVDKRLRYVGKTVGSDEQSGISDPHGGYLVPPEFSPNLFKVMPEADPIGDRVTRVPMALPSIEFPARVDKNHTSSVSGGLTVTRRPETVAGTASRMTLEKIRLDSHSLFGLAYATEEILMDSPISFAALLAEGFSDQFTYHLINERISGTGVGEFLGVLNSPCLVSVAAETGQDPDTIVYENVIKMRARCWGYGNAVWICNHDCTPDLMLMNQALGTGGAIVWQPSAREDRPDTLLGRPLIFSEYAQTIGNQGDIILGNWSEYLEGLYQPMQSEESIHVRFVNHERTFKFWLRNAGQPWWRSALTPKNSTATLSPFVVLDAR